MGNGKKRKPGTSDHLYVWVALKCAVRDDVTRLVNTETKSAANESSTQGPKLGRGRITLSRAEIDLFKKSFIGSKV